MAGELQTRWATGATIKCDVRPINGGTQVGDVTLSESSGYYAGDFPSASAGHHMLIYYDTGTGNVIAQHAVYWTGSAVAGPPTVSDITADVPTANENADALLDRADGVESSFTLRKAMRLMLSALVGKCSGLNSGAPVFRDVNDLKNRISATSDASGNRSSVSLDGD